MRIVVQRVSSASCSVEGKITGEIGKGYLLLVGIEEHDTKEIIAHQAYKVAHLRIFEDEQQKLNRDIFAVGGAILSISQFTLYGDARKGNRPSFVRAMKGEQAKEYYEYFNDCLRQEGLRTETGIFGADMKIALVNDGPVTILLEEEA